MINIHSIFITPAPQDLPTEMDALALLALVISAKAQVNRQVKI